MRLGHNRAMLHFPQIDPIAFRLGPLAVHWYGITYLAAFAIFLFLATRRLQHEPFASLQGPAAWSRRDIDDMLFLGVLGVILGGRLGYCLFYKPARPRPQARANARKRCRVALGPGRQARLVSQAGSLPSAAGSGR